MSLGAIVRDENGLVLAAATWRSPGFDNALLAEASVLYNSMKFAVDCGFWRIVFEGDSEKLMKMIQNGSSEDRSYLGAYIKAIQTLQSSFDICRFLFIHREANITAHNLAQFAHSINNSNKKINKPKTAQSLTSQ